MITKSIKMLVVVMNESLAWCGIDLNWAYSDVLRRIGRRTACIHRAKDILHDALVFFCRVQPSCTRRVATGVPQRDCEPPAGR